MRHIPTLLLSLCLLGAAKEDTPGDRDRERARLLALQSELWSKIREQAIDAEREVQHA